MTFLILAVLCLSCINIGFAVGHRKRCNHLSLCFSNYFAATVGAFFLLLKDTPQFFSFSRQALLKNLSGELTPQGSFYFSVIFGLITGIIYLFSLIVTQHAISQCGAGAATMFQRLGILVPILASVFIFHEIPTGLQIAGILLSLGALFLLGNTTAAHFKWLLLTFLVGGMAELCNKLYQEFSMQTYKPLFLFLVFLICLLLSLVLIFRKAHAFHLRPIEFFLGIGIGCLNLAQAGLVIYSLEQLPAAIVFPVLSAGVILLTTAVSAAFFQEKITPRIKLGVLMILGGIVLLNL